MQEPRVRIPTSNIEGLKTGLFVCWSMASPGGSRKTISHQEEGPMFERPIYNQTQWVYISMDIKLK